MKILFFDKFFELGLAMKFFSKSAFVVLFFGVNHTGYVLSEVEQRSHLVIGVDERVPSFDSKIGRMQRSSKGSNYCTATLISDSCVISAGHCSIVARSVHFNIPFVEGIKGKAAKEDIYQLSGKGTKYVNKGPGRDWGVFKVKRNKITKLLPGEKYGYYQPIFSLPTPGQKIKITSYGHSETKYSTYQQSSEGTVHQTTVDGENKHYMEHTVDTSSSSSGAVLFDMNQRLVGIHTHSHYGKIINIATAISQNAEFIDAIKTCVDLETK